MKKRIAIQLFGHLRTFECCAASFMKHVVEPNMRDGYDVDIFIHTWDEIDHATVSFRNANGARLTEGVVDERIIERVRELYHPRDILVTPQQKRPDEIMTEKLGGVNKRSVLGPLNMSYSLYNSSELRRKSDEKYDWVIVTRPDIYFMADLRIDEILSLYDEFKFDIPKNALFFAQNPYRGHYGVADPRIMAGSDLVWFARPDVVDVATSLFENFDDNLDKDNFYCMEVWWMDFFRKKNLVPMSINYDFQKNWIVLYQNSIDNVKTVRVNFLGIQWVKIKYDWRGRRKIKLLGFITLPWF